VHGVSGSFTGQVRHEHNIFRNFAERLEITPGYMNFAMVYFTRRNRCSSFFTYSMLVCDYSSLMCRKERWRFVNAMLQDTSEFQVETGVLAFQTLPKKGVNSSDTSGKCGWYDSYLVEILRV
jgi:hypothetical protein